MDLVLMGGIVLTMDALGRRAEAVAVKGGRIAAVGASAEIVKQIGPETAVVHLAGRTLVPGFIDPHNHFSLTTFEPVSVDCRVPPLRSISGVLDAIAATAKDTPRGRWIRGWGFDARLVQDNRRITRGELDEVAPHNPVCLLDYSCHRVTRTRLPSHWPVSIVIPRTRHTGRSFGVLRGSPMGPAGSARWI